MNIRRDSKAITGGFLKLIDRAVRRGSLEASMDLLKILKLVYKYKWLIIAFSLFTLLLSSFVSVNYIKDQYRASSVMIISSRKNSNPDDNMSYNDYALNVNLVNSYRVLCKTDNILNKVLDRIHQPLTASQLSGKLAVEAVNNTEIIRINAVDHNPHIAALIANCTAQVFESEIPVIMKMDNVQIIDIAAMPAYPYSPNRSAIVVLSLIGCLGLCAVIIVLCEYFDTSIKAEAQLEELLGVPVLCSMPHTKNTMIKKEDETLNRKRLFKHMKS